MRAFALVALALALAAPARAAEDPFVRVEGDHFTLGGRRFSFVGANLQIMHGERVQSRYKETLAAVAERARRMRAIVRMGWFLYGSLTAVMLPSIVGEPAVYGMTMVRYSLVVALMLITWGSMVVVHRPLAMIVPGTSHWTMVVPLVPVPAVVVGQDT